jgi:ADP-heptose:LPS heptosyltransferase
VIFNPNASDLLPQRRWPRAHFARLAKMILDKHPDILILLTGAPAEREGAEDLKNQIDNARCINFAGNIKFKQLPVLYTISTAMISNDSGPAHFAATTPLPTFVIFGPETPDLYGSLGNFTPIYQGLACSPCVSASNHRKTPCTHNVCVTGIQAEFVFALMQKALSIS